MTESGMAILIRHGRPEDVDALVALLHELFLLEADFEFNRKRQEKGLSLLLADHPERFVLVAEKNGQIIGMCTAQVVISTAEGGEAALVEDVVVANGYRGQGIGKRLMATLEKWANQRGIRRLQLLADRENVQALAFYDRLGWAPTQLVCRRRTV